MNTPAKPSRYTLPPLLTAAALLVTACGGGSAEVPGSNDVRADLSSSRTTVAAQERVVVRAELTNATSDPLRLLRWHLPVDGKLGEPLFTVTRDGVPVDYLGRLVKRLPPREQDFVVFAPGQRIGGTVDLTESYDFSTSGTYTISWAADDAAQGGAAPLTVVVEGREHPGLNALKALRPLKALEAPNARQSRKPQGLARPLVSPWTPEPTFTACTIDQAAITRAAWSAALDYANDAAAFMSQAPADRPRFRTWFGSYTSRGTLDPWVRVQNNFQAIQWALDTQPFEFVCDCYENASAWTYAWEPFRIHLCEQFWWQPMTGANSKAGTIIHETSHFGVVASTGDYVRDYYDSLVLAIQAPATARWNADNYQGFAENYYLED